MSPALSKRTAPLHGMLWGVAGYITFCLAPAAGLPPELPGTMAADLSLRQDWWGATALATATALTLLVFSRHGFWRLAALVLIAAPHLVGAPQPADLHALAPDELQAQFRMASLLVNAVFWVVLGGLSGWWLWKQPTVDDPLNVA